MKSKKLIGLSLIAAASLASCYNKNVKVNMIYNNKGMDDDKEEIVTGRRWIKQNLEILKNADFLKKLLEDENEKEQRSKTTKIIKDLSFPEGTIKSIDVYYIPERGGELIGFDVGLSDGTFKDYRFDERSTRWALDEFSMDKELYKIKS